MLKKSCLSIIIIFLGIAFSVQAQNSNKKNSAISLNGDSMQIDRNKKVVTIIKDVCVRNDQFTLTCDTLHSYYLDPEDETDDSSMEERINKLVADGNVIIKHANGDQSEAGHVEYDKSIREFVLTENPKVHFGENKFSGCKITYNLRDDRIKVESCGEEKAAGTIYQE